MTTASTVDDYLTHITCKTYNCRHASKTHQL